MSDVLATIAQALSAFAVWLDSVSPIPWPLALAILFPPMVVAFRLWVWFMRGSMWPTSCAYPTTKKTFCKRPAPGEWYRCWEHRRNWTRRTDRHAVNPALDRWEARGKNGRRLEGASFLRNRRGTDTLLFQKYGFARRPLAVARYLLGDWKLVWRERTRTLVANVKALRVGSVVSEQEFEKGGVSQRAHLSADVMRAILPALAAGLCFTALSVPLDDGGRQIAQYVATACFVAAWGFARYGLWQGLKDWRDTAHRQTGLWFGTFMIAALIAGTLSQADISLDPVTLDPQTTHDTTPTGGAPVTEAPAPGVTTTVAPGG